jgi:hypothetical protein
VSDSQYGLPLLDGCGVTSRKRIFAILRIAAFLSLNLGLATGRVAIVVVPSSLTSAVTVVLVRFLDLSRMAWH